MDEHFLNLIIIVLFFLTAQRRIFGIRSGFAFRCSWSLIVNGLFENVGDSVVAHVVRREFLSIHELRDRAANFEWNITSDLCEMANSFAPKIYTNRRRLISMSIQM